MVSDLSPIQKEILSGLTTGSLTTLVVHPLDLIKIRLQLLATSQTKTGYWDVIKSIRSNSKLASAGNLNLLKEAYRGLGINLIGNTIAWGVYFGCYRMAKDLIYEHYYSSQSSNSTHLTIVHDRKISPLMYLSAGGISGIITAVITNPIWVIKTRVMSTSKHNVGSYASSFDGLYKMIKHEGLSSLSKGLLPSIFGVSQGAIYFMVYDTLKFKYSSMSKRDVKKSNESLMISEIILITSLSKMISVTSVYPFQLIKSNLQSFSAVNYSYTFIQLLSSIYKKQGIPGLYKGLTANLIRAIPSTCITFCIYENFRRWI